MSISKISKVGPGCIYVISALMLFGIAAQFLLQGNRGGQPDRTQEEATQKDVTPVVAQVGDYVITAGSVTSGADALAKQMGQDPDLATMATALGQSLTQNVQRALTYRLLKDQGVQVTTDDIRDAFNRQFQQQIDMVKMQMQMNKELDPKATDADFRAALKKHNIDLDQARTKATAELDRKLKDPTERAALEVEAGGTKLAEKMAASIPVSDDLLKRDFDQLTLKRILVPNAGAAAPGVKAADALKALKGGMPFEQAMNKFSLDRTTPGKVESDKQQVVARKDVAPEVKTAVDKLKPGEVTGVLDLPEGAAIYKLVSVKPNVPKDFEKTKAAAQKSYRDAHVGELMKEATDKLKASNALEWKEPSFEALYRLDKLSGDNTRLPDPKNDAIELRKIIDMSAKPVASDETVLRVAALTRYRAFNQLYSQATPEEKKKMSDERIEVLSQAVNFVDSTAERLNLAELYAAKKDKNGTFENLNTAAQRNNNEMQNLFQSQQIENRIVDLEAKYNAEGLLSPDQQKELADTKKVWEDAKKQQEEEMRKAEEDRMKAEEEAKKSAKTKAAPGGDPNITLPGTRLPLPVSPTPAAPPKK